MLQIEESINVQISNDVKRVLVEEQGYSDNISTFGLAVIQIQFARLIARAGAVMIRAPEIAEHEAVWGKTGRTPTSLSFWVNALVGAFGRERHMADMYYLFGRRFIDGRSTMFDL